MIQRLIKLAAIVIIGLAIYNLHYYWRLSQIEKESQDFVNAFVFDMSSSGWSPTVFKAYTENALTEQKTIDTAFASYRRLGKVVNDQVNCKIQDYSSYKYKEYTAKYVAASYVCIVQYEKGAANLQLAIVRFQDTSEWKITYFNVISNYFVPPAPR